MGGNLYVHFPFCRTKCRYCALASRANVASGVRAAYAERILRRLTDLVGTADPPFSTVYFGGGTPALCDLGRLAPALAKLVGADTEFTVELHPLDVADELLGSLADLGVNRISMGVQSLDDATLSDMGRGYTADRAARAFAEVKGRFDNAGVDFIVGYPGDPCRGWERLASWGLRHCSVYSLQNERNLADVPEDDVVLDRIREVAALLKTLGLARYEISNYAQAGFECRHNLAVWRGEDYVGVGDGAFGRVGRVRTPSGETLSPERDRLERALFRLRTREGLDATRFPEWKPILEKRIGEGLLVRSGEVYTLTERGTEVCDSILADLV